MNVTRALWAPLRLALGRALHRPGRQALVALGVAAAIALLAGVIGGGARGVNLHLAAADLIRTLDADVVDVTKPG